MQTRCGLVRRLWKYGQYVEIRMNTMPGEVQTSS
jgi:hypothetical protein